MQKKLSNLGLSDKTIEVLFHEYSTRSHQPFNNNDFFRFALRRYKKNKNKYQQIEEGDDPSIPLVLESSWLPSAAARAELYRVGVNDQQIDIAIPDFIFYYNSKIKKSERYSVDMQFVYHVRHFSTLQKQAKLPEHNHASIVADWQPREQALVILNDNYDVPRHTALTYVSEFVFYWQDRGCLPAGKSFQSAFVQYAITRFRRQKNGEKNRDTRGFKEKTQNRSIAEQLTDRSWAIHYV